jgi:hypothetical protein
MTIIALDKDVRSGTERCIVTGMRNRRGFLFAHGQIEWKSLNCANESRKRLMNVSYDVRRCSWKRCTVVNSSWGTVESLQTFTYFAFVSSLENLRDYSFIILSSVDEKGNSLRLCISSKDTADELYCRRNGYELLDCGPRFVILWKAYAYTCNLSLPEPF